MITQKSYFKVEGDKRLVLDSTKKYKFKKELLEKDPRTKEAVGQWAAIVNNREVTIIEEGKRASWTGNVIYNLPGGQKQQVPEMFFMESEWLEEIK